MRPFFHHEEEKQFQQSIILVESVIALETVDGGSKMQESAGK